MILQISRRNDLNKNPLYYGVRLPKSEIVKPLEKLVPEMGKIEIDLLK